MAKPTTTTTPAANEAEALFSADSSATVFGGSYQRLILEEGEVSPMLVYTGKKVPVEVENERGKETLNAPLARIAATGELVTLPIGAVFQKNFSAAEPKKGERMAVKRFPNATKQKGLGKGNKMEVYAIAFPDRAPAVD